MARPGYAWPGHAADQIKHTHLPPGHADFNFEIARHARAAAACEPPGLCDEMSTDPIYSIYCRRILVRYSGYKVLVALLVTRRALAQMLTAPALYPRASAFAGAPA
jgi:hypothetical protein